MHKNGTNRSTYRSHWSTIIKRVIMYQRLNHLAKSIALYNIMQCIKIRTYEDSHSRHRSHSHLLSWCDREHLNKNLWFRSSLELPSSHFVRARLSKRRKQRYLKTAKILSSNLNTYKRETAINNHTICILLSKKYLTKIKRGKNDQTYSYTVMTRIQSSCYPSLSKKTNSNNNNKQAKKIHWLF